MSQRSIGWAFVAAQAALIGALVIVPSGDDFTLPGWLRTASSVVFWLGVVLAVAASVTLGRSLTATPVPTARATLRTTGPYRFVRHPIYTGVLLIVVALAARSGTVVGLVIGAVTIAFFHAKAAWEELRLAERFANYPAYAAATPRFLPRPLGPRFDSEG